MLPSPPSIGSLLPENKSATVDTIVDICVSDPLLLSVGGKAYYSLQAILTSISWPMKRDERRGAVDSKSDKSSTCDP